MHILRKILFLLACTPAFATVIVQKNGDVISGRILEEKADKYIFQSPYGKLQIAKANVVKLILDEKTIELKNVQVGEKTVKARLVNQDNNTSVYLTEDGQTIRKQDEEKKPEPASQPEKKSTPRDKILVSLSGLYGFSSFQREATEPGSGGMPPFDQALHGSTFGAQVGTHYTLHHYLGVGLTGMFMRAVAVVDVQSPSGPGSHESTAVNSTLFAAPSVVFSLLGNLGSTISAHDLRLELQGGISFNAADMQLVYKNSSGFPANSTAAGKNISAAIGGQVYYCYSFSESFRLRLGLGYFRSFTSNIYDGTLQNAPQQGQFKADFEKILSQSGQQPQVISVTMGAEIGF